MKNHQLLPDLPREAVRQVFDLLHRTQRRLVREVLSIEGKPAQVELPSSVQLKVVESADGVRGDSANNVQKPAKLETGISVNVPLFVNAGDVLKIDTRTGEYLERANK